MLRALFIMTGASLIHFESRALKHKMTDQELLLAAEYRRLLVKIPFDMAIAPSAQPYCQMAATISNCHPDDVEPIDQFYYDRGGGRGGILRQYEELVDERLKEKKNITLEECLKPRKGRCIDAQAIEGWKSIEDHVQTYMSECLLVVGPKVITAAIAYTAVGADTPHGKIVRSVDFNKHDAIDITYSIVEGISKVHSVEICSLVPII